MDIKTLPLGMRAMLLDAIDAHRRLDPHRRPPRRFVLHPSCFRDLALELRPEDVQDNSGSGPWRFFCGVEIVQDNLATRPKMITADNQVEYL